MIDNGSYGKELILDLHDCDPATFTRSSLAEYIRELCKLIDMKRCSDDLHFWDYEDDLEGYEAAPEHLKGITIVQLMKMERILDKML